MMSCTYLLLLIISFYWTAVIPKSSQKSLIEHLISEKEQQLTSSSHFMAT